MRPTASFALHAIFAAAITAFGTTGASANEEIRTYTGGRFFLDIGGERGLIGSAEGDDRHQQRIEIESWSWGAADAAPPRTGGSNQIRLDDTAGKEKSPSSFGEWIADVERPAAGKLPGKRTPPTVTLKRGMTRSVSGDPDRPIIAGNVPSASATPTGANETLTVGGGRTETASGQATGKRQHMPIRARAYYDQPLAEGSVWIRVATPWAGCRLGARYPSLALGGGAKRYVLEDVTVASCGGAAGSAAEEVAFTYNKIAY